MSHDAHAELVAVLDQYAAGSLGEPVLRACLEAPRLSAALRALVGQRVALPRGDLISVGSISDASGVAIGAGAIAIGQVTLQIVRQTTVQGSQTTITGNVTGPPVLSGTARSAGRSRYRR